MMAGHLAVGLALKKVDRRINLGLLLFAVLFIMSGIAYWLDK